MVVFAFAEGVGDTMMKAMMALLACLLCTICPLSREVVVTMLVHRTDSGWGGSVVNA